MSDPPALVPLDAERMQAILDGSPFIHFCGMRVTALDPAAGKVVLAMELRPELERRQGTGQWHGGAIAGLIDTVGDAAVALGLGAVVPTINFRVDYLRPATNPHLTATATVLPSGANARHLILLENPVKGLSCSHVAVFQSKTLSPLKAAKSAPLGLNLAPVAGSLFCKHCCVEMSHTDVRIPDSAVEAATSLLSGENVQPMTISSSEKTASCLCVATSQRRNVLD